MKFKIAKLVFWIVAAGIGIVLFFYGIQDPSTINPVLAAFLELLGGTIFGLALVPIKDRFVDLWDTNNWKTSQTMLKRGGFIDDETFIRISFAYLFRIKVNGEYFLIKNERGTAKYQPVGGAYKMNLEEAKFIRSNYIAEDDDCIAVDKCSKMDYRLRVPSKFLRKFFKRFDETSDRETYVNITREFSEELFDSGVLSEKFFSEISYRFIGRHITPIRFEEHFQCYEVLLADIFELEMTPEQELEFSKLTEAKNDKYIFASDAEIQALGIKKQTDELSEVIADHSQKILISTESKLLDVKNIPHSTIVASPKKCFKNDSHSKKAT